MMRLTPLALALAALSLLPATACHNSPRQQTSAPAPSAAANPDVTTPVVGEVRTERHQELIGRRALQAEPRTRQDSLRLAALRRADSAGALVDSLIVTPATLRLRVGDSLSIEAVHVDARDMTGARVLKVAPLFNVAPRTVVRLQGTYLVALTAGEATLLIRPYRFGASIPSSSTRPLTRVPVQVVDP